MGAQLQTDPFELRRWDLEERFTRAIDEVQRQQAEASEPLSWHTRQVEQVLELSEAIFVPDGQDAIIGQAGKIIGGIMAVFGFALLGIVLEGDQAEPWMPYVAPPLILAGAYLVWKGRKDNAAALAKPRITGAYIFDDVLLCVDTIGCKLFPVERVRGFDFRSTSGEGGRYTFELHYVDDDGKQRAEHLLTRDISRWIGDWMARAGSAVR